MQSVVITGASTGIGAACALRLAREGWQVFAGVRKEEDGRDLEQAAVGDLTPVRIDVTDDQSIEGARKLVEDATGGHGLHGLVNNAGITVQGALEYLAVDDLRRQFDVNVTGQIAVTQAFLPSIRAAGGRIVFMSSIAGRAPALPFLGPYAASKKAIEALADSLRIELLAWGIEVSIVEPGSIATPIWEKGDETFDDLVDSLPAEGRERYGVAMDRARKLAMQTGERGIPADEVAKRVEHALTSKKPRTRYLVGKDARARALLENPLPDRVRDRIVGRVLGLKERP
ncbi:MAG: SDR family oxidoreductase [Actinomycetota bacterium]